MNYELRMDYCTSVRVEVLKDELLIKHNVPMLKITLDLQWRITQKSIRWIADVLTYVHTYVQWIILNLKHFIIRVLIAI